MDIVKVDRWTAPVENGAPLLCMPNVVKPCHGLNPRTIMGAAKWKLVRTKCYMDADYRCEVCGEQLKAGICASHELYSTDYINHRTKFERYICVCKNCHDLIHSGRSFTMFKNGYKYCSESYMLAIAKRGMKLVHEYNLSHPDTPIRMYGTLIDWSRDPELGKWIVPMIEQYDIKFYSPINAGEDKENWGKWRLLYNGKEYEPKYKDAKEWREAMNESRS